MLKVPQVPQDLLVLQEPLVLLALLVQLEIQAPQVQQVPPLQLLALREPQVPLLP